MSCEHGLTTNECYVCMSPKYGEHDIKQQCVAKPQGNEHMSIEAMKQALEALEYTTNLARFLLNNDAKIGPMLKADAAITALRQAIEQASSVSSIQSDVLSDAEKQEPVATLIEHLAFTDGIIRFYGVENMEQLPVGTEFYTTPQPQRQWVGLTDEEVADLGRHELWIKQFIRIVEAKLKERNHVN